MQLWGSRVIVWNRRRPPHKRLLWTREQQKQTLCRLDTLGTDRKRARTTAYLRKGSCRIFAPTLLTDA